MVSFSELFDASDFPARWQCGNWSAAHGWLHIVSDLGVWSAYVAIPLVLGYFVLRKKDVPFRTIFWLFGAFILACGTTHLMEAIIFWWPAYRLAAVIKLSTAIVSWATVLALIPVTPLALAMRSPDELEREIAARKDAEDALKRANADLETRLRQLRETEQRFRLLVEGTKDCAIFMLDPTGKVISWNPGAERLKGYRAEEIIGQHFSRFCVSEDVAAGKPERELAVAAAAGHYEDEGWRIRKDGSRFWASVLITALRDESGNLCGFSKITRDRTEKRQAEETAQRLLLEEAGRRSAEQYANLVAEQREQLRVTLESIGDAVIATDGEGNVTMLNRVAEALTGWHTRDAAGKPLPTVFQIINEKTRLAAENPVAKVLASGAIVGLANHTILIAKDGTERPIDDSAAPIRDAHDRLLGVVLVFRDISERRSVERALEEADRRKDDFLATLAHELRNPLAPIRNAVEVLRRGADDTAVIEQVSSVMERQLGHMVRLVDDLLDISRIANGKLQVRKERVDLSAIVQAGVETSRPLMQSQGHELTVALPREPIYVDGDTTRLAQVFSNLLNNAAKYTEKGGRVWLTAEKEGDSATVSIRDTGIGIAAEHLPHLFEKFSQAAPALERSHGGLGVGLALVHGLVELHGGSVQARSAGVGKGSEFIVRLPLAAEMSKAEGVPAEDDRQLVDGRKCRILVIDDNRDAADSLALVLQMMGHETHIGHDGLEAVQAAASFRPDVVLLDIGLPRMNGYEAAREIRRHSWGQDMVLIALTGWGQEEDKRRAFEAGFNHHLTKPVGASALEKLLSLAKSPAR